MDPLTAVAYLFLLLFAVLSWKKPRLALLILLASLPSYLIRFNFFFIPCTLLEGMITVLFFTWFARSWINYGSPLKKANRSKRSRHPLHPWRLAMTWWLIAATLSVYFSSNFTGALGIWKAYFIEPLMIFTLFMFLIKTKRDLSDAFWSLSLSALALSLIALVQKFTGWGIPSPFWQAEETRRVVGLFEYPNALALFLAPVFILLIGRLAWAFSLPGKNSLAWAKAALALIITILAGLAIFWTKSEGAMLGIFSAAVFMGIMLNRKTRMLTLAAAVALFIAFFAFQPLNDYLAEKLTPQQSALEFKSEQIRLEMWQETIMMLGDRPIKGAGLSGYQTALRPYHQKEYVEIFLYPHNIFLTVWSELGMLGLAAFMIILIKFFILGSRIIIKNNDRDCRTYGITLMAIMVYIIVHGMVDVPYFKNDLSVMFWVVVGALTLLYRLEKMKRNETDHSC